MRINLGQTKGNLPDQAAEAGFGPLPQIRSPKDNSAVPQRKLDKAPVFDLTESPRSQNIARPIPQEKNFRPLESKKPESVNSELSRAKLPGRFNNGGSADAKAVNRGTDVSKIDSKNLSGKEDSEDKTDELDERFSKNALPFAVDLNPKPVIPQNPSRQNQGNIAAGDKTHLDPSVALDAQAKQIGQAEARVSGNASLDIGVNAQELMKKSPVIAFLTGHLEKVEPAEIPKLVAGTPFIQRAMQEDNLGNFLDQPRELNDLLKTLGIDDPSVGSQLSAGGLSESAKISARQLFDKLGVSATRVEVELDLLKKNLTIDGVSNYMRRAQVLQSSQVGAGSKGQAALNKSTETTLPVGSDPNAGLASKGVLADRGSDSKLDNTRNTQKLVGDVNSVPQVGQDKGLASMNLPGNYSPTPPNLRAVSGGGGAESQPNLGRAAKVSQAASPMTKIQMSSKVEGFQNGSAFDQFGSMMVGTELKSVDYSAASLVTEKGPTRFQDVLVNSALQSPITPSSTSNPIPSLENILNNQTQQILKVDSSDKADRNLGDFFQNPALGQTGFSDAANKGVAFNKLSLLERSDDQGEDPQLNLEQKDGILVGEGARLVESDPNTNFGADGNSKHSESGDQKFESDTNAVLSHMLGNQAQKAKFQQTKPFDVQNSQGAEIAAKILEHAKISAQKGGGETVLNLGDQFGGQLEVAIRVVENRVDIRILTSSDDLRNAMFSDLNRLTESLSQHKLSMGKVEVGLNQQFSTNNQQFGQGGFNARQDLWQSHREQLRDVSAIRDLARRSVFGYGASEGRIGAVRSPYVSKHPNGGFIAVA